MPKMVHFGEFLKTGSLRSNSVTRKVNFIWTKIVGKCQNTKIRIQQNWWKIPKFKNSDATFLVIFKHCVPFSAPHNHCRRYWQKFLHSMCLKLKS